MISDRMRSLVHVNQEEELIAYSREHRRSSHWFRLQTREQCRSSFGCFGSSSWWLKLRLSSTLFNEIPRNRISSILSPSSRRMSDRCSIALKHNILSPMLELFDTCYRSKIRWLWLRSMRFLDLIEHSIFVFWILVSGDGSLDAFINATAWFTSSSYRIFSRWSLNCHSLARRRCQLWAPFVFVTPELPVRSMPISRNEPRGYQPMTYVYFRMSIQ